MLVGIRCGLCVVVPSFFGSCCRHRCARRWTTRSEGSSNKIKIPSPPIVARRPIRLTTTRSAQGEGIIRSCELWIHSPTSRPPPGRLLHGRGRFGSTATFASLEDDNGASRFHPIAVAPSPPEPIFVPLSWVGCGGALYCSTGPRTTDCGTPGGGHPLLLGGGTTTVWFATPAWHPCTPC